MTPEQTAAAGIELAKSAIIAIADGLEDEVLRLFNGADHATVTWTAAYLLSCLRESVSVQVKHDHRRLELALKTAAEGADEDALMSQVAVIVHDEERRL